MSQPPAPPSPEPGAAAWSAAPPPSWAPGGPPSGPAYPAAAPPTPPPARSSGPLLLAAGGGLVAGLLTSGLVVAALFAVSAEDVGATMADRIGSAVEDAIIEGTRIATEESLEDMGAFEEDLLYPGGGIEASEQFPPVPPEELGPDPVLDAYAEDCFAGDLQACDDLFYESPPMSGYEEYASSCGGRVKAYALGSCTELE